MACFSPVGPRLQLNDPPFPTDLTLAGHLTGLLHALPSGAAELLMALEARLPPPQPISPTPHGCGDPQSPQGLGPVVSGRNLGELCSLSSPSLGSWAGTPDYGKSHVVFTLLETKELVASCTHGQTLSGRPQVSQLWEPLPGTVQTADKVLF